jgi:hypothetical protein
MVNPDGTTIEGARLTSAITFLQTHHQLKISPFDLLADRMLSDQLDATPSTSTQSSEWTPKETKALERARRSFKQSQRVRAWQDELRASLPTEGFADGHSAYGGVWQIMNAAVRALRTGDITPCLVSSWTGFAPSALERGERPWDPARSRPEGNLVDWYRDAFALAAARGLIDEYWYPCREEWQFYAFRDFQGEPLRYYDYIHAAARALGSPERRRSLETEGDSAEVREWFSRVFAEADRLGLCVTPSNSTEEPDPT